MNALGRTLTGLLVTLAAGLGLMAPCAPLQAQPGPGGAYCASNDNRFARCQVPWRDAVLVQQASKVRCIRGETWGFDRYGIWVDRGCRGQFAPADDRRPPYGMEPGRPPGWGRPSPTIRCESHGGGYQRCPVELRRDDGVRLVNQLSGANCQQGRTWGWNRDGIWVDRGCRADFVIERR